MQFGIAARNNLVLVMLFALAFGSVIFYVNAHSNAQDAAPIASTSQLAMAPAQEIEPPHGGVPSSSPDEAAPVTAQSEATPPATPKETPLTEQQAQNLQRWSNQVVSAHRTETRADAIRELAALKNQESIRALAYAISSDEDASNRLLAVQSLNSLASEGYEVNAIRDTLRMAAADVDQDVADHAKEAYDTLMRKDDAQ